MKKNRILITGCAGFIGGHALEQFLDNNCIVVGVDKMTYAANPSVLKPHKNFTFYEEDICNTASIEEIIKRHNIECILNFAAESHVDNSIKGENCFIDSNITGTKSLMEACKEIKIPICHISTDEVYGPTNDGSFSEEDKLSPKNFYSATKAAAEHIVCAYSNTFDINYTIIRMSNNYGPRQNKEKFIPTVLRSLLSGVPIPVYGDGTNIRDWIYVKDSVSIIYNILQNTNFNREIYNLSLKDERTNIEVISVITKILGFDLDECVQFVKDRLGHDFRYSITNDKIKRFIDFKPTDFKQGMENTIKYYHKEM